MSEGTWMFSNKTPYKELCKKGQFDAYVNVVGRNDIVGAIYGVVHDSERYLIIVMFGVI